MLFAEVEPRSSTHRPSCEFNSREISPIPLDRRVSFCGAAGPAAWFEELRKNFIKLSATDAIFERTTKNDSQQTANDERPTTNDKRTPNARRAIDRCCLA
jgi:hypothetical protein